MAAGATDATAATDTTVSGCGEVGGDAVAAELEAASVPLAMSPPDAAAGAEGCAAFDTLGPAAAATDGCARDSREAPTCTAVASALMCVIIASSRADNAAIARASADSVGGAGASAAAAGRSAADTTAGCAPTRTPLPLGAAVAAGGFSAEAAAASRGCCPAAGGGAVAFLDASRLPFSGGFCACLDTPLPVLEPVPAVDAVDELCTAGEPAAGRLTVLAGAGDAGAGTSSDGRGADVAGLSPTRLWINGQS